MIQLTFVGTHGMQNYFLLVTFFFLLISKNFARAYSISWVYEDLVAHPQYKVVYENQFIPNSSLENIVFDEVQTENSIVPSASQDTSNNADTKKTSIMMRTASGQSYICQIPYVSNLTVVEEKKPEEKNDNVELMNKGLALLEPMKDDCLYYIHGWWTYEYCHLRHVQQFHGMPPAENSNVVYLLGRYDPRMATLPGKTARNKHSLGTDLQAGRGKKYLVQRWGDGTTCDLTGEPRKVEIQFHCNPQSRDGIALVKEMYTCYYLIVIHTPRLCNDPAFHSKTSFNVNPIECWPIEQYERSLESQPKSLESDSQEENSSVNSDEARDEESKEETEDLTDKDGHLDQLLRDQTKSEKLISIVNMYVAEMKDLDESMDEEKQSGDHKRKVKFYIMNDGQIKPLENTDSTAKNEESSDTKTHNDDDNKEI
ncbi:7188_t:CDS:2 [Acaulospora morrowiae]|uniref:Protein OS-9 homolog n=1 Tax=Acaulospora morrowiae TaxID=94023 RepID=A0A9N8VU70_9GLOM|nr:7188_t:CDS:2 [Acaulospora morrowiae]